VRAKRHCLRRSLGIKKTLVWIVLVRWVPLNASQISMVVMMNRPVTNSVRKKDADQMAGED
jgi:hypothetical protein